MTMPRASETGFRSEAKPSPPATPDRVLSPSLAARLTRLVAGFARPRVLVIGDLMLDRFIWGDVRRISPEAPVPVVQVKREGIHPGGAGNVVANLTALGARPAVIGWTGPDEAGAAIRRLLEGLGADASGVIVDRDSVSIEKTRVVAHSQQLVRLDREPTQPGPRLAKRLTERVARVLRRADVVVVSDYGKGTIPAAMLDLLAAERRRRPLVYLIDPKQPNFAHYRGATLVKPNELETAAAAGIEVRDDETLAAAGERLIERWQSDAILISRGEHGMCLFRRNRPPQSFPTAAREVFDVTGAGDTVLAVAALALGCGGSLEEAALLANLGAGVVVGKVGTATVDRAELGLAIQAALAEARSARRRASGRR
jgi:D-glycero-beta-D-manno-heptose-7-phosphate kinase